MAKKHKVKKYRKAMTYADRRHEIVCRTIHQIAFEFGLDKQKATVFMIKGILEDAIKTLDDNSGLLTLKALIKKRKE